MRFLLACCLVASTGCRHAFPLPYGVPALLEDSSSWPGEALVHYLSQPDASLSICALAPPDVLRRTDETLVEPFVASLEERTLSPERWQACATQLIPSLTPTARELTWDRLGRVILQLAEMRGEAGPRLRAAAALLAARAPEPSPALEDLLPRLERKRSDPLIDALVQVLEIDMGRHAGHPLVEADLATIVDDAQLLRMCERLPSPELRKLARRRLIALRIERSETVEVKARAAEVAIAVMETGRWAQPSSSLVLEPAGAARSLEVVVRQDVEAQVVALVAPRPALEKALRFPLGWSRPLSPCRSPVALDVEPCIDPREVEFSDPRVSLDGEGVLLLPDRLPIAQAVELLRANEALVLSLRLGGQAMTLSLPLRFEEPGPMHFEGAASARGPAVNVLVRPLAAALIFAAVSETGAQRLAIYPRGAALPSRFEVASLGGRGASGASGANGADGTPGINGLSASCSRNGPAVPATAGLDGTDGGPGRSGGDGGRGGDGGLVSAVLECGSCAADESLVRTLVRSRGGAGGLGGDGGRGGHGGKRGNGGSGQACQIGGFSMYFDRGLDGEPGRDGGDGSPGTPGADGLAGPVLFKVRR